MRAAFAFVGAAGLLARRTVAPQQFDLQVIQRIDVGKALAQRGAQQFVFGQQFALGDALEHFQRQGKFPLYAAKDAAAQRCVRHQAGIAPRYIQIGFGQDLFHIG